MTGQSGGGRRLPLVSFLVAEGISYAGNKVTMLALPWLVLTSTGSATRVGVAVFAQTGCYVVVKATGSPLIDRIGRRRCAIAGGFVSAVLIALVPALSHTSGLPFAGLVGIIAVLGAVQSISDAAKRVMVPDIVAASGRPLERVTSLYAGVERLSILLGTPAAGLTIAAVGPVNVFLLDAAACALAAFIIAVAVPAPSGTDSGNADAHGTHDAGYLAALREGLRYVRRDRFLVAICALLFLTNLIDQALIAVFIPAWVKDVLGNPAALGTIMGTYGLGAVLGSALFAWLGPRMPRYWTFALAFALAGPPPLATMALTDRLPVLLAVVFAAGVVAASINPILSSAMFERVPQVMHARIFGLTGSFAWAGMPIGGLLGGIAVDRFGRTTGLLVASAAYLVATLTPLVFPGPWRALDRQPAAEKPARAAEPVHQD